MRGVGEMRREAAIESRGYRGGDVMNGSQDVKEGVRKQVSSDTVTERAIAVILSSKGEEKRKLTESIVAMRLGVDRLELAREFDR